MNTYKLVDNKVVEDRFIKGSGYLPCPKNLIPVFSDDNARCYLYFYTKDVNGNYSLNWDVINLATSENRLNYLYDGKVSRGIIRDIPENTYMRIAVV
jgi:hypothetical protein